MAAGTREGACPFLRPSLFFFCFGDLASSARFNASDSLVAATPRWAARAVSILGNNSLGDEEAAAGRHSWSSIRLPFSS